MGRLFGRTISLILLKPTGFFLQRINAITMRSLRIEFRAEKHLGKDPNSCEISIYNLNAESRSLLEQRPLYAKLAAGYIDDGEEHIFEGDISFSESVKSGPNWETRIQLGDGERGFRNSEVNRSFHGPTTVKAAVKECASALGINVGAAALALLKGTYSGGLTLKGKTHSELTRILNKAGKTWSIQDGVLQILGEGEVRRDQAVVISRDTGMIGSPSMGNPPEKGKPPTLRVEKLLSPHLKPGGLAQVSSLSVNGRFRMERIQHSGDSHGRSWESIVEATPL